MADEHPNPPEPVPPAPTPEPPAGAQPVPPAQQPVPPAGVEPVPPTQNPVPPAHQMPVPPAGAQPVPPAQQPVPPAGQMPVPPAQQPVPPAQQMPVPPAQQTPVPPTDPHGVPPQPNFDATQPPLDQTPGFQTVQLDSTTPAQGPSPAVPPINQGPTPNLGAAASAASAAGAGAARSRSGGRRGSTKKKSGKRKVASRPGTRPGAQRKPLKTYDSGFSFMSVLMAFLGIIMLGGSIYALLPQSLTHIEGYPTDNMNNKEPKNLLAAGQKILETRTEDATFTEQEVNDYINYRLNGLQKGAFGGFMKVKGIYVDLRPNEAEIFIERSLPLLGTTTMSSVVKSHYNDIKHQQSWKMGGGSIGKIPMKDRSLQPILNSFLRMSKVGSAELEVMNYMADVKIGEDKITLDSAL